MEKKKPSKPVVTMNNKKVILLVNLGSPEKLSRLSIYRFLSKFLSDKRVVPLPKIFWYPLLHYVILPLRVYMVLEKYGQIWGKNGYSPLINYTMEQAAKLQNALQDDDVIVLPAFSYSFPYISTQLDNISKYCNITHLQVISLYPQFSSTTTSSVFDQVAKYYANKLYLPKIDFMHDFHDNSVYINAISDSVRNSWKANGRGKLLMFSYHSLPQKLIDNGDIYLAQCITTTEMIAQNLGLNKEEYTLCFQSKFGRAKWVEPATDKVIKELVNNGVDEIDVVCPGFFSDCLETLEEIDISYRELFLKHGGKKYTYIPCLNSTDLAINVLQNIVRGGSVCVE